MVACAPGGRGCLCPSQRPSDWLRELPLLVRRANPFSFDLLEGIATGHVDPVQAKQAKRAGIPVGCRLSSLVSLVRNTRDETRTRKTQRSGDFESPASTNSATRAPTQCSRPGNAAQRDVRAAVAARQRREPLAVAAGENPPAAAVSHPGWQRT